MADYYVKVGGDGSAPTTDPGTGGDWSSAFDSIDVALDTAAAGETIYVSDGHSKALNAAVTLDSAGTLANPVRAVCVEDLDTGVESSGAIEGNVTTQVVTLAGSLYTVGVDFNWYGDIEVASGGDNLQVLSGANLVANGGTGKYLVPDGNAYGATTVLRDCIVKFSSAGQGFETLVRHEWLWDGGAVDAAGSAPTNLLASIATASVFHVRNVDLSHITGNLVATLATSDDNADISFTRCKLGSGVTIAPTIALPSQRVIATSCDTGDGYHYFEEHYYQGINSEDTGVYRTDGATYDGTNGFSANMAPSNVKAFIQPLSWKVPAVYIGDLSSSITLTFHCIVDSAIDTPAAITDAEFWVRITRPDGTDQALGVVQLSRTISIVDTPNTLTTSTATWNGERTYSRLHQIAVTIPALTGVTNAVVGAEFCLAAESLDSGDEFYVCPKPVVT